MYNNCNICNKIFATKESYNRHINNPNVHIKYQENVKKYICDCGKMYLHRQSLGTHKKQCNQIKPNTEPDLNQNIDYIDTDKETLIEILLKKEKQVEELQKQVETEKLRNTIINGDINNDNLNIQINAFGCENLEYISDEFKLKCVKQIYKSIPEMVIKIHFNTKYPENHNVKIPNKKLPYASIMTADNKWKTVNKNDAVSSMLNNSFTICSDTYDEHKGELSESKRKNYERYQDKFLNNDKELHKQLTNEVACLVLDGTR
jgi:hypothetical protein